VTLFNRLLPGRADRVDRVALAGAASAHVPGGVDLGDLLVLAGQVPGQAQPVMPGALDRPGHRPASGRVARPLQQLGLAFGGGWHLQLRPGTPAGITDRRGMGVRMGVCAHD
jgi:hypothetical protein